MATLTRVQKFIALSGLCSRRKAEVLIEEGRVKVNGEIISIGDQCLETDVIKVDDKEIKFNTQDLIYILLNKSKGYVSTKSDEFDRKTIYDFLDPKDNRDNLFSIGRLDKDTSGLIILTNDGQLTQDIIHPSKSIAKDYIAVLNHELTPSSLKVLEAGIELDDVQLRKCTIKKISDKKYKITLYEGKNRQIRKMFEKLDYEVVNLHRIRIGGLDLKELNIGFKDYVLVSKKFVEEKIFRL
jgi:23S rRNA pseudouridine2605 synthase